MSMTTDVLLAIPVLAFGVWRLLVGLQALGVIALRIPDRDPNRSLPKFMQSSREIYGFTSLVGGVMFTVAAVLIFARAFR